MKIVAIALWTELTDFGWDDLERCKDFPGSCWLPLLRLQLMGEGFSVQLSKTVREAVQNGEVAPTEVGVIQVDQEEHGRWLLENGAQGIVIQHGESPLAIPEFYADLAKNAEPFRYSYFFAGMLERLRNDCEKSAMLFPSYSEDERQSRIRAGLDDSVRRFCASPSPLLSFVANNNYWRRIGFRYFLWKPKKLFLRWSGSPEARHYRWSRRHELYTTRLETIEYFAKRRNIALFGSRWDTHPIAFGFSKKAIQDVWRGPIKDKYQALNSARFNFCPENSVFPGYVTEKIFHAFIAGVPPVYVGGNGIENFVPTDAFVDATKFKSVRALADFLESMSLQKYQSYLAAALDFLQSEKGYAHTYEAHAQRVVNNVLDFAGKK